MEHAALINQIVQELQQVRGINTVVLGGSRARGTHTPTSDIDLGLYYDPNQPMDLEVLNEIATRLDDTHRERLLTPEGGWGPWINGGGWLKIQGVPVDFLYRDLRRVTTIIEECHAGHVDIVYQPGHPHGFVSCIYMAEVAVCQPLWQKDERLAALKARTQPYPTALQKSLIGKFAWEISFALANARKAIPRGDLAYLSGCAFRSVACMLHVLFALNLQYWLNEKGAIALADTFPVRPQDLQARTHEAFRLLGTDTAGIAKGIDLMENLGQETEQLIQQT